MANEPFVFVPNIKQAKFLSTNADICLIGGGIGSGKTLVAVIQALRINDPTGPGYLNPRYNALICRKHYKDLRDIIAKTKLIYKKIDPGAVYHSTEMIWKFSSGAMIQIAHFDCLDSCVNMVQGAEYQNITIDEAMHFNTDEIMLYLMSRLRNTFGMQGLLRLTSNPGKYPWLRDFFRIDDVGTSTDFYKEYELEDGTIVRRRIKYIQAKLSDNPHIPKEYAATIMMMSEEDKLALLDGMWNAYTSNVSGQVYQYEIKRMLAENRLKHITHDPALPVHTFFDIGTSDMTVILFVQFLGDEIRIIDMIKDNNKSLNDFYAPEILKRATDLGYKYAGHYLPHDGGHREWTTNIKIIDQARTLLGNDVQQLPKVGLADGIQLTKTMFSKVIINKDLELFNDLVHYRRQWMDKLGIWSDDPLHDKHSHAADAFRMISYYQPKPKNLVPAYNPYAH